MDHDVLLLSRLQTGPGVVAAMPWQSICALYASNYGGSLYFYSVFITVYISLVDNMNAGVVLLLRVQTGESICVLCGHMPLIMVFICTTLLYRLQCTHLWY